MQNDKLFIVIIVVIAIVAVLIGVIIGCKQLLKVRGNDNVEEEFIALLNFRAKIDDVIDFCIRFQLEYNFHDGEVLVVAFREKGVFQIVTETRIYQIKITPSCRVAEWTCQVGLTGP